MNKNNHIVLQTGLTCLQYLIPAFLLTHLSKEQSEAISMSLAAIQAALAIGNHVASDKKEEKLSNG